MDPLCESGPPVSAPSNTNVGSEVLPLDTVTVSTLRDARAFALQLADKLETQWQLGRNPLADEYVERFREHYGSSSVVDQIISREILLREESGEVVDPAEIERRFPDWRPLEEPDEILTGGVGIIQSMSIADESFGSTPTVQLPEVGDSFGDYRLIAELGRGGQGRVFLAEQPQLADRLVALKVTVRAGDEHISLARLQHTHIVPLFGIFDHPSLPLRAFCMPYLGLGTLSDLFRRLDDRPVGLRTGLDLANAVKAVGVVEVDPAVGRPPPPASTGADGPAFRFLKQASYVDAICWIVACIADALAHMHERGLVHLDVKPSNILIGGDGQPLLLDFHLARSPIENGKTHDGPLGGTPGYMSPEQQEMIDAVKAGVPVPRRVDERSDVYSLGLVLCAAFSSSQRVDVRSVERSLRKRQAPISPGLCDVVLKCFANQPRKRYQSAAHLAQDLRRHMADMPLLYAPNRNLLERWRKRRRRKPYTGLVAALLLALFAAVFAAAGIFWRDFRLRNDVAEAALSRGKALEDAGDGAGAVVIFREGVDALEGISAPPGLEQRLNADIRQRLNVEIEKSTKRLPLIHSLHKVVDELRFLGARDIPDDRLHEVDQICKMVWKARRKLAPAGDLAVVGGAERPASMRPDAHNQSRRLSAWPLEADLQELAILWTEVKTRAGETTDAPANGDGENSVRSSQSESRDTLEEAEDMFGSNVVLSAAKARLESTSLAAPADLNAAAESEPQSVWEWYALGRMLLRDGRLAEAESHLRRAVELEPDQFWPNYYQGLCAHRLAKYDEAIAAFRTCIALAPDRPECYENRGRARLAAGDKDGAKQDFEKSRALKPQFDSSESASRRE